MTNVLSKNGLGLTILIIQFVLTSLGVEFEPGSVEKWVEAVLVVFSGILLIWNQVNRSDVKWFWFKK